MNPFGLSATGLMVWGLVAHLIADWPLQNDWMATNKAGRLIAVFWTAPGQPDEEREWWWLRHPAAYVHAGIHGLLLAPVFGWPAAVLAVVHLIIDTRWPVERWSRLVRQTQPQGIVVTGEGGRGLMVDVGLMVRFWTDQVFHVATIAVAALIVGAL